MRLLAIILLGFLGNSQGKIIENATKQSEQINPPLVFWKFNTRDKGPETSKKSFNDLFWSYYKDGNSVETPSNHGGNYERDSPMAWRDGPNKSPLQIVAYYVAKGNTTANSTTSDHPQRKKKTEILALNSRPRLSHGPRRRRNAEKRVSKGVQRLKEFLNTPLYCWKILINCKRNRSHECCPVMPNFLRHKDDRVDNVSGRRRKRSLLRMAKAYLDPQFGIPIANPNEIDRMSVDLATPRADVYSPRSWDCSSVDCYSVDKDRGHPCCVDRIFPIGPFVQTSLFENWTSALFEVFGNSPILFVLAKKFFIATLFVVGFAMWGFLGHQLGFVSMPTLRSLSDPGPESDFPVERRDLLDMTSKVILALDDGNWMEKLKLADATHNFNRFLCCMSDPDETRKAREMGKRLECYPTNAPKSIKFNNALACVSELVYDVTLNKDKTENGTGEEKDPVSNEVNVVDEPRSH